MSVDTDEPARRGLNTADGGNRGPADRERETIRADIIESVLHRLDEVDLHAVVSVIGSADEVAERMVESLPLAGPFDEEVGPFYDTAGLRRHFRLSRQAVDQRARRRDLLCLKTSDGHRLYPAFQFDRHGAGIPRLREVLAVWPEEKQHGPWQAAAWLNAAGDDLDGMTPAQALRTDRVDDVLTLARQAGALWRR